MKTFLLYFGVVCVIISLVIGTIYFKEHEGHPNMSLITVSSWIAGWFSLFIFATLRGKISQNIPEKSFDYPRPTSGEQIKVVYTPIEYVQAGERLLQQMREEQDKQ